MQNCKIFFVELYFSEKLHFQLIVDRSVGENCLSYCVIVQDSEVGYLSAV